LRELLFGATPELGRRDIEPPAAFASTFPTMDSWMSVPLAVRDDRVGVLLLASEAADAYGPAQSEIVATLAGEGMIAYENARLFAQVRELATIDGLSGVPNRRHFFDLAEAALTEANAARRPLAALMLDIDRFKLINDTHGHQVGDEVIRAVAARLVSTSRTHDIIGRYGGEEFALIIAAADGDAIAAAERIRSAIGTERVQTAAGLLPVTVSIGFASLDAEGEGLESLLGRADACLYAAKVNGRNRVALAA
jgi:diguanylate cyclase (GGDEF)-like protein